MNTELFVTYESICSVTLIMMIMMMMMALLSIPLGQEVILFSSPLRSFNYYDLSVKKGIIGDKQRADDDDCYGTVVVSR